MCATCTSMLPAAYEPLAALFSNLSAEGVRSDAFVVLDPAVWPSRHNSPPCKLCKYLKTQIEVRGSGTQRWRRDTARTSTSLLQQAVATLSGVGGDATLFLYEQDPFCRVHECGCSWTYGMAFPTTSLWWEQVGLRPCTVTHTHLA